MKDTLNKFLDYQGVSKPRREKLKLEKGNEEKNSQEKDCEEKNSY